MAETRGQQIIRQLRKKWIRYSIFSDLLLSLAVSILFTACIHKFSLVSAWWGLLVFLVIFASLFIAHAAWKTSEAGIAQLLNRDYPALEESSGLLPRPVSSLNSLERLQYQRTEESLAGISAPLGLSKKIKRPLTALLLAMLTGSLLYILPYPRVFHSLPEQANGVTAREKAEILLPQVNTLLVTILPPAYTSRAKREQDKFNLVIEEGSSVNWQLTTTLPVKDIRFIFNDSAVISLQPLDSTHRSWQTGPVIPASGFYQLSIDSSLSELYKIETIRDLPPVIHIQSPKQYTTIDFGEEQQVLTRVDIGDDYGVREAIITATIASGSGEAVKFKEQKIALPGFSPGRTQYQLLKLLSLPALGMQPGDELYFYVSATDSRRQETRSDIYIIHLPDTAQLMSLDGLGNGINLKPEYFRSQRQIIIETEQLLKEKDTITTEAFRNRSNNLGIDQKMLRLRYGKFLGEEDESGLFEGEVSNDLSDPSNFSNAEKIKDAFTDKHDNAEDATFLEPEVKAQLKATLTEMWNAELQLRTFKPQQALPFEYKALRLLKDLQQKSRAYVAKTSFKTTPLDLQKRLTGDLSKITAPVLQQDVEAVDDPQLIARMALGLLEQMKITNSVKDIPQETIRQALMQLNETATRQPSLYLSSVQALRKIISDWNAGNYISKADIRLAENGLQRILHEPAIFPAATTRNSSERLPKQYFLNLQKKQP